jgi:hypothetical protein
MKSRYFFRSASRSARGMDGFAHLQRQSIYSLDHPDCWRTDTAVSPVVLRPALDDNTGRLSGRAGARSDRRFAMPLLIIAIAAFGLWYLVARLFPITLTAITLVFGVLACVIFEQHSATGAHHRGVAKRSGALCRGRPGVGEGGQGPRARMTIIHGGQAAGTACHRPRMPRAGPAAPVRGF